MADITESNTWEGVYKLETTDPVKGGGDTEKSNLPHKNLTNRTKYLKTIIENIITGVQGIIGKLQDGSTCANAFSGGQQNDTAVPSTAFVQSAISKRAGTRNLLLNGNMKISQRGTTFAIPAASELFTLDRWLAQNEDASVAAEIRQIRADINGVENGMFITIPSGCDSISIIQRIPGCKTLEEMSAAFQMLIKSNAGCTAEVMISQYLNKDELDVQIPTWFDRKTITINSGTARYTDTFTIPAITFTQDTDAWSCLEVSIQIVHPGGGSDLELTLANVQLESGLIASDFEERDDFNECLKFFEITSNYEARYYGSFTGGTNAAREWRRQYYHHKRRIPEIAFDSVALSGLLTLTDPIYIGVNACTVMIEADPDHPPTNGLATARFNLFIDAEIA